MSGQTDATTEAGGDQPATEKESMGIDLYERRWILVSVALLVGFFITVSIAGFTMGFGVPGADQEVDPRTVADSEPWSTPGLREISPGKYEAYIMAETWSFSPREMEVPVGSEVVLYVTSKDLQHGFKMTDTNINMMVVPGQVSKLTFDADKIGEFPYLCTEYCGQGHAAMYGQLNVVSQEDFEAPQAEDQADTQSGDQSDGTTTSNDEDGS